MFAKSELVSGFDLLVMKDQNLMLNEGRLEVDEIVTL